ncbi:hypothetical protein MXB_1463 [Myxobolus squamalis]|nr:hypothetical protein MXB_1463 [Myxobolus squamalis]
MIVLMIGLSAILNPDFFCLPLWELYSETFSNFLFSEIKKLVDTEKMDSSVIILPKKIFRIICFFILRKLSLCEPQN